MSMAERIKELRIAAGLTQDELGEKLGVQKSAIAKYENGRVENIKRSTIAKMACLFGVKPSYLLAFDEDECFSEDPDSVFIERYGQAAFDVAMEFLKLDSLDQGRIIERMEFLLSDSKYKKEDAVFTG